MEKERYRIKGKTYYKVANLPVNPNDADLVSEIWAMENPKGTKFKLLIKYGKSNSFVLYEAADDSNSVKQVCKTYSISRITR